MFLALRRQKVLVASSRHQLRNYPEVYHGHPYVAANYKRGEMDVFYGVLVEPCRHRAISICVIYPPPPRECHHVPQYLQEPDPSKVWGFGD